MGSRARQAFRRATQMHLRGWAGRSAFILISMDPTYYFMLQGPNKKSYKIYLISLKK